MAKRKKREARRSTAAESSAKTSGDTATRQPSHASPPKRNLAMLAISLLLFAGWFGFLIYIALGTN